MLIILVVVNVFTCFCFFAIDLSLILTEFADRREGINPAVTSEVADLFKGKTTNQLRLLEDQIKTKLSGGDGIDVGEKFINSTITI